MQELWAGLGWLTLYFIACASAALALRFTVKIPDEVFRKTLHLILLGSLAVWVTVFDRWWLTAVSAIVFALVVYPILCLAQRLKNYSQVVTERKAGELKASLLVVFFMFAAVVSVCWGLLGDKLLTLAAVYAWGFGDAAAALVGKRFGRHRIARVAGGRKSVEGSDAMFCVSALCVAALLWLRGGFALSGILLTAALTAAVTTLVELVTPDGMDTITCPFAAMAALIPLTHWLGGGLW